MMTVRLARRPHSVSGKAMRAREVIEALERGDPSSVLAFDDVDGRRCVVTEVHKYPNGALRLGVVLIEDSDETDYP